MYNGFDYDKYDKNEYYQTYRRPAKRRSGLLSYIAVILVTSILCSVTVGSILYGKFSAELEAVRMAVADKAAVDSGNEAQLSDQVQQTEGSSDDEQAGLYASAAEESAATETGDSNAARDAVRGTAGTGSNASSLALAKNSSVTAIAKAAGPSIVGIRMTISGTRYNYFGSSNNQVSEGSGIIITEDGYIMTNYHVVSGADPKKGTSSRTILEVFLPDGREAKAEFKGGDEKTDLAVIKIDLKGLPTAEIGDSSKLEVGELAVAIGNPLGMEFAGSVTVGVISALNRTIDINGRTMNLIQTDAAINEGNSGGALLNSQGQVIGINSAKIAASGVEGLGFAIPINDAWPIVNSLIRYGYVKGRPYIGISGREISSIYASYYGLAKGIYITSVAQGSGAEKAGIRIGDIIVSMAGKTVETVSDLDKIKESYKPGDTVTVVVDRNGNKVSLKLTFGEET